MAGTESLGQKGQRNLTMWPSPSHGIPTGGIKEFLDTMTPSSMLTKSLMWQDDVLGTKSCMWELKEVSLGAQAA